MNSPRKWMRGVLVLLASYWLATRGTSDVVDNAAEAADLQAYRAVYVSYRDDKTMDFTMRLTAAAKVVIMDNSNVVESLDEMLFGTNWVSICQESLRVSMTNLNTTALRGLCDRRLHGARERLALMLIKDAKSTTRDNGAAILDLLVRYYYGDSLDRVLQMTDDDQVVWLARRLNISGKEEEEYELNRSSEDPREYLRLNPVAYDEAHTRCVVEWNKGGHWSYSRGKTVLEKRETHSGKVWLPVRHELIALT